MTKLKTENRETTALRELCAEELDLVSGGGVKAGQGEQTYLVFTMTDCSVTTYQISK